MLTARDSVIVKTTGLPSTPLAAATLSDSGSSLSVIVPVAVAVASVTSADAFNSTSVKVSSGSSTLSSRVTTDTVLDISPDVKVSTPDVAVKSMPLVAVPGVAE